MTEYDSPQSEPDPDVQPKGHSPDDAVVVQLPAWEMLMPVAPIPNGDKDRPADKPDYEYFESPYHRRSTTAVRPTTVGNRPRTYGGIPIVPHPEPIWKPPFP